MTAFEVFIVACLAFYVGMRVKRSCDHAEIRLLRSIVAELTSRPQSVDEFIAHQREASPWQ